MSKRLTIYSHKDCYLFDTGDVSTSKKDLHALIEAASTASNTKQVVVEGQEDPAKMASLVHTSEYLRNLQAASENSDSAIKEVGQEAFVSSDSWRALGASALVVKSGCDDMIEGVATQPFCVVGPGAGGHHAEPDRAMGYNTINWIAVAAQYLKQHHGLKRIAVIDIMDMHRANGTEVALGGKQGFYCVSTHIKGNAEYPYYSSTEKPPPQHGNILNIDLPLLTKGRAYRQILSKEVLPKIREYNPDALICLIGCDSFSGDPTGYMTQHGPFEGLRLSPADIYWTTQKLKEIAESTAQGRLLSINGGGYDIDNMIIGVKSFAAAMCGDKPIDVLSRYASHRTLNR